MVQLNLGYELNHIYAIEDNCPTVLIGNSSGGDDGEVELFEKSLALTSDLKRLPVLRSLTGTITPSSSIYASMVASGIDALNASINIYTEPAKTVDSRIWVGQLTIFWNGSAIAIQKDMPSWDYEGGVLLGEKLYFDIATSTDVNVSGANLSSPGGIYIFLEIDWAEISKKEFENYILESVYAKRDE